MKKISIIVPVYNTVSHIERCINSILEQTYTNFELIIVDDGSNDGSEDVCDYYRLKDDRIVVKHISNKGVSFARNVGIELANNDYIMFIDSDDYIDKDYLESFVGEEVDIVMSNPTIDNQNNKSLCNKRILYKSKNEAIDWKSVFLNIDLFSSYCKVFRKSIINKNKIRFPVDISWGEDAMFVADYLQYVNTLNIIDCCGYHYVKYSDEKRATSTVRINVIDNITYSREHVMERLKRISEKAFKNIENEYIYDIKKTCGYFVKFLFEDKTMPVFTKIKILERFMKNKYVVDGAKEMVVPYTNNISVSINMGKAIRALFVYRFLEFKDRIKLK